MHPYALYFCPIFFCQQPWFNIASIHGYYSYDRFFVDASKGIHVKNVKYTPKVKTVTVDSANVGLNVGDKHTFTATGHDRWGNATETNLEWSATGGSINSQTGEYQATETGTFYVYCKDKTWDVHSDSAAVTVTYPAAVSNSIKPVEFNLEQNYPNPFNPHTTITFALPQASHVVLKIYDIRGALVRTLVQKSYTAGHHSVIWDGTNDYGQPASSGSYMYKLESENRTAVKKMVYLK